MKKQMSLKKPKKNHEYETAEEQKVARMTPISKKSIEKQDSGHSIKENQLSELKPVIAQETKKTARRHQSRNQMRTKEKAAKPVPTMITSERTSIKSRGKPQGKVVSKSRRSFMATPIAVQVSNRRQTLQVTPRVSSSRKMIRKTGRGSTAASRNESENNPRKKRRKERERQNDLLHLKAYNSNYRRRLKNVKSKLFSETKCFRAYKSARQEEAEKRRNKRTKLIAKKTQLQYADRSIDFNEKSKRQKEQVLQS